MKIIIITIIIIIIKFLTSVVSDVNGYASLVVNGKKNEVTSPGNKQAKGEGEIKMDVDVFRQVCVLETGDFIFIFCTLLIPKQNF